MWPTQTKLLVISRIKMYFLNGRKSMTFLFSEKPRLTYKLAGKFGMDTEVAYCNLIKEFFAFKVTKFTLF